MVTTARELLENIDRFRIQGMKYWYGGKGEVATKTLANSLRAQNPSVWTDAYYEDAICDIDGETRVCDCSGYVCIVYEIPHIGSYAIRDKFKVWSGKPKRGMIAWRPGHVGIIIDDNGTMAEMRSLKYDYKENRTYKEAAMQKILYSESIDYDSVQSVGWHKDNEGWWYAYGNKQGQYLSDELAGIGSRIFAFNKDGYLVDGLCEVLDGGKPKYVISTGNGIIVTDRDGFITSDVSGLLVKTIIKAGE